jgi:pilus assembly protein CpaC
MHNKTNYTGCPRSGRMVLRTLSGVGALGGLVTMLAAAAVAAPAISITERAAAKPAAGKRVPIALDAVRQTPKAPRLTTDARPTSFILQTAQRRLTEVASRDAGGTAAIGKKTTVAGKPAVTPKNGAVTKAAPAKVAGARPAPPTAHKGKPVRVAQATAVDPTPAIGDLRTAPPATDSRIRNFGSVVHTIKKGTRNLKVGESQVLEFRWVSKIAVGDPSVADVVAISDNQVLVNGKKTGETNLFVWDKTGQYEYKVAVDQGVEDLGQVARTVSREIGRDDIRVRAIGDSLFLFGQVKSQAEQQQAEAVAAAYTKNVKSFIQLVQDGVAPTAPGAASVADALNEVFKNGSVRARALADGTTVVLEGSATGEQADQARKVAAAMARGVTVVDVFGAAAGNQRQVLVRARVVDIDRVKGRSLGIDWGPVQIGAAGTRIVGEQPFQFGEAQPGPIRLDQGGPLQRLDPIGFKLRALEQQNAARVLSEPNLLVMEGSKGGIHIGGEIPIPVAQQAGNGVGTSITVEYKPFGIRLDVEAISINDEGVTLRISPEVSALDYTNAVTVNGFNLPALRTRRADSVVHIKIGQTLAIGGLLQNDLSKQVKAIPILSKIPILGELFKDTRFQKGESELVILVTPELPGPGNTVSTPVPNVEIKRPDPNIKPGR